MLPQSSGDHRLLAKRMDLYHIEDSAPGMIYWHQNGWTVYRLLEDFIRGHMMRSGYQEVRTPQILPQSLWEISGHWDRFGKNMFSIAGADAPSGLKAGLALKPMSCPGHLQIFNAALRSWRDLPFRICEFGQCHRDEPSGSLHGMMRTRSFEQDDAHILCTSDQVQAEVAKFVNLLREVYRTLGFVDLEVSLSLRPALRAGTEADWDLSERQLLEAALSCGLDPRIVLGDGAFYGPKLEFSLRDIRGRAWQCGTIQLDRVLPERLSASYVGQDGNKHIPVMLHHAVLGSIGRFIGIMLENSAGNLPFWLAPVQVAVLPIADAQHDAAQAVVDLLRAAGMRPALFGQAMSLGRRIVLLREQLVPAQIVIGKREAAEGFVMLKMDGEEKKVYLAGLEAALHNAFGACSHIPLDN